MHCICYGITGCSLGHESAKNGGIQESEDNELDLSEADFAPAHCSELLKPYAVNGNEFDGAAFDTAVSDATFPTCNAHHVADDGITSSKHTYMTSGRVRNDEAAACAPVHYDAIGLPLCTENLASDCHEAATCQNSVLSSEDVTARSSISTDNRVLQHDSDGNGMISGNTSQGDVVTTEDMSSELNVSSTNSPSLSATDKQIGNELDSDTVSDVTVTCERSDEVESVNACHESAVSGICSSNPSDLECKTDTIAVSVQHSTENVNWDINGTELSDGECHDISVSSVREPSLSASQAVSEVQREETVTADGDICPAQMKTDDTEEEHDGMDEVDKTVPSLYQMRVPAASLHKSFDSGAVSGDGDHLSDENSKSADTTGSESLWVEKEFDEVCGIDHVERITVNGSSKSRATVQVDGCSEVLCVGEDFSDSEYRSESSLIAGSHKTTEVNEATVSVAEPAMCETSSCDMDTVTSSVPEQLPDNTDHQETSALCSVPTADGAAADVTKNELSLLPGKEPLDISDSICNELAADGQNQGGSSESLQKRVEEEMSISDLVTESLEVWQKTWPLSVNDAGDAQDAELHHELSKQGGDDGEDSEVMSDAIAADAELSAENKMLMTEALSEVQLNNGLLLDKTDTKALASATEPGVQELDLSLLGRREVEQERCCLNDNEMPKTGLSEFAGHDDYSSVSSDSSSVSHDYSSFNAVKSSSTAAGTESIEKLASVVDTPEEMQSKLPDDVPVQDQQQTYATRQSDEDAEKWFEEQFAACEDFDVDEFVSSAWSAFHPATADSGPAVSNLQNEMLEQAQLAAGDHQPVEIDTADAWQHVENATVAGSSVDDFCAPSSDGRLPCLDSEMEATTYSLPSFQPEMPQTVSSAPSNHLVHY